MQVNGCDVVIDIWTCKVDCDSEAVKNRIQSAVDRFEEALKPCALEVEDN